MYNKHLKVAAIHDLSGLGRCSLSVILPCMSAMGIEVCPVPTAILSTHTGGFGEVVKVDLTDYMEESLNHYKTLDFSFDCIYTGYLSSAEQVNHCKEYFECYRTSLKVVDPVMGDQGKLYRSFDEDMVKGVCSLVTDADIITPNLTEAAIILGEQLPQGPISSQKARSMLARLSEKGPNRVVITGVTLATGEYANICYDREHATYWKCVSDYMPISYPGTGDIFASVLIAGILTGDSLPMSVDRATRYVETTIKTTYGYSTEARYGVFLEDTLELLTSKELPHQYEAL